MFVHVLFPLSKLLHRYRTRGKKKAQFHIKVQLNSCLSVQLLLAVTCHVTPVFKPVFVFFLSRGVIRSHTAHASFGRLATFVHL